MRIAGSWNAILVLGLAMPLAGLPRADAADKLLTDNSGCNGEVSAFAEAPDGRIYLAGAFSVCGGVEARGIVAYDPVLARYAPLGTGIDCGPLAIGACIGALAWHRDELYVGGFFQRAGDVLVDKIARWNGQRWAAVGDPLEPASSDPRWDGPVSALAEFQGQLYAGGAFNNIGRTPATNVARWDGERWTDVPLFRNVVDAVHELVVFQGQLYAGGFSGSDPGSDVYRHVARYDGVQWQPVGGGVQAANPQAPVFVSAFTVHDSALYAGGQFGRAGNVAASGIARWDGTQWTALGNGIAAGGSVSALASFAGTLVAAGDFEVQQDATTIRRLARWDGRTYSRVGSSGVDTVEAPVRALLATPYLLHAGGEFTQIDGLATRHVARWNTRQWQALDRLPSTGIVGYTQALALTENALYVGGQFSVAGGVPARSIARWNGSSWAPLRAPGGEGTNSLVTAIAVAGTDVYVGGYFSEVAGLAAKHIARWDGSAWHTVGQGNDNGVDGPVHTIQIAADGIYVGGEFQQAGGQPARHLARWQEGRWTAFGEGPPRPVHSLALAGTAIYAGGGLRPAVGSAETRVDRWNGQAWTQVYEKGGGPVTSLVMFQGRPHFAFANQIIALNGTALEILPAVTEGTAIVPLGLAIHRNQLHISGYFDAAGTLNPNARRARWDGSRWLPFWTEQPQRTMFRQLASQGSALVDIDSDGLRMSPPPVLHSVALGSGAAGGASTTPVIARNGVRLAFASTASDLGGGGGNGRSHVYLRDPTSAQSERISDRVAALQPSASEDYREPSLSADGASIAFSGSAGQIWAVIHGVARLASSSLAGAPGNGPSQRPMLAGKGRHLLFESRASNLVVADGNGTVSDIFRKDLETGVVTLVSVGAGGEAANGASVAPWASDDGRSVVFISNAGNLTPTPSNAHAQAVLLREDATAPQRLLLSRNLATGEAGNGPSSDVRITPDGRFGVFASSASNLVADDGNNASDIFFFEIGSSGLLRLERLSLSIYGEEGNAGSFAPSISDDGRVVAFASDASNLVELDRNGQRDVLLKDTRSRNVQRLSRSIDGLEPNGASERPLISGDASAIVFQSAARNLAAGDSDADVDIYSATLIERTPIAIDTPLDQPRLAQFALPAPSPPNAGCPGGFFVATISDGPATGVVPGLFGVELLLDEPGTRTLAGGLNFGGTADIEQAGFAGFNIANAAGEPQRFNLRVTGNAIADGASSVAVRIRVARRSATASDTVYETTTSVSRAQAHVHSLVLQPAFYEVTVTPQTGTPRGDADAQFFVEATTSFVDRPGGGFQGGAVVGGYHSAAPGIGVSGFAGFCLATPHTTSVRVLARPSYGDQGAQDLRLRLLDEQSRAIAVLPRD